MSEGTAIPAGDPRLRVEQRMAGASAVWLSTAIMVNPQAPLDVLDGIVSYMKKEKLTDIAQLVGIAKSA